MLPVEKALNQAQKLTEIKAKLTEIKAQQSENESEMRIILAHGFAPFSSLEQAYEKKTAACSLTRY